MSLSVYGLPHHLHIVLQIMIAVIENSEDGCFWESFISSEYFPDQKLFEVRAHIQQLEGQFVRRIDSGKSMMGIVSFQSKWELSPSGLSYKNILDQNADQGISVEDDANLQIPASDRYVRADDNLLDKENALKSLDLLVEAIKAQPPNDVFANYEQRMAVLSEVVAIRQIVIEPYIRLETITNAIRENGALRWLVAAAAAGTIGNYATDVINALLKIAATVTAFGP